MWHMHCYSVNNVILDSMYMYHTKTWKSNLTHELDTIHVITHKCDTHTAILSTASCPIGNVTNSSDTRTWYMIVCICITHRFFAHMYVKYLWHTKLTNELHLCHSATSFPIVHICITHRFDTRTWCTIVRICITHTYMCLHIYSTYMYYTRTWHTNLVHDPHFCRLQHHPQQYVHVSHTN